MFISYKSNRIKIYVLFNLIAILFISLIDGFGQSQDSTDYLYPIQSTNSEFSGKGMDWLLSEAQKSQYVLFGEQHGVKKLGDFISFTIQELNDEGFKHLGLEMDDWSVQQIKANGLEDFISKYPNSIAFGYDGELQMIQTALKKKNNLVGFDQMVTAVHPFQRLRELSLTSSEKRLSQGAFLKASLKMGEYLREEHFEDFQVLKDEFANNPSPEVHQILNELETSMKIYSTWRAGQRGEVSKRKSPEMRESMMKDRFDGWISNQGPEDNNKAVIKMGGAHLMYGIGPNGIETLGEHIHAQATQKEQKTFSVGIRNYKPETSMISVDDFGHSEILVVDTKMHRDKISHENFETPNFQNNQLSINGFDAIIYFKNAEWSNQNRLSKHKTAFRSGLINGLIPLVILFLACLISVLVYLIKFLKSRGKPYQSTILFALISSLFLCCLTVYQILEIRNPSPGSAQIMMANSSIWIFILISLLTGIYIFLGIRTLIQKRFSTGFRIYLSIMAIAFSALSIYCYYWNIGGML